MTERAVKHDRPQVGPSSEGGPTVDSDRVKAPVVNAGSLDSGESQTHVNPNDGDRHSEAPSITVSNEEGAGLSLLTLPRSRRGSAASLSSCRSGFSNATAEDLESCDKDREKCRTLRREEREIFLKMEEELNRMLERLKVQKNVAADIQSGLKKFADWLPDLKKKHEEADKEDDYFYDGLKIMQDGKDARRVIRERIQAKAMRNLVLECEKKKRAASERSPPKEESQTKKQRKEESLPPKTDASVLGKLRKDVDPGSCQATVVGVGPTKEGNLLLRSGGGSDCKAFAAKVAEAVNGIGTVRTPEDQKVTLEIRDLDGLTEKEEVVCALEELLQTPREKRQVMVLGPNRRGAKLAIVVTEQEEAKKLVEVGRLKVGFLSCQVRRRLMVTRCHRCLAYGHRKAECKGVDRSSACYKCGESGHSRAECTKEAVCFLCSEDPSTTEVSHEAGSGKCSCFRKILEQAKKEEALKRSRFRTT